MTLGFHTTASIIKECTVVVVLTVVITVVTVIITAVVVIIVFFIITAATAAIVVSFTCHSRSYTRPDKLRLEAKLHFNRHNMQIRLKSILGRKSRRTMV